MAPPLSSSPDPHPDYAEFARAFPFHLVIAPTMHIQGIGDGLARLDAKLAIGLPLEKHFELREPAGPISWSLLVATPQADFCLVHRKTGLELRGRMAITEHAAVFLGTSWLDDAEQLADFGLSVEDLNGAATRARASRKAPAAAPIPATTPDDGHENAAQLMARCRQLEQCLRLHQAVSRCLAETNDADEALALLVETLPQDLGWAGATLWRRNAAGEPVAEKGWPDLAASSPTAALAANAFSSGAPVWSANGCAGRAGFAIPAHTEGGTIAAITCVSHAEAPDNDEFARQLYLSTGQLARYMARQRQKERLTRLTSELTAIFQLSADGFVAFNDKGTLSYLNTAFARMIGVDRDDLRGLPEAEFERRLAALLDPDQTAASAGGSDQVIRLSRPRSTVLQRSRREARDIEGRLIGRLLYFRDITLETELLRANGEFLSNAAHELRTPMASIHGFIELLLKRDFTPEKRRGVLETIHSQSSRLSEIVDELLEVARFDARAARDLDCSVQPLVPVVEATVGELLVRNDARTVELALPAAPQSRHSPLVRIDRGRFVQALTNVLSNAYKYSPNGGAIELAMRQRTRSDQEWVGVSVRDHGIGMTETELQHVFERFFRARPSGSIPGTGLGMSMVKKIIDAHGGVVEVTSAPGEGTEVTLWLPVHATAEAVSDRPLPA